MVKLSEFGWNRFSQFGDDGAIAHCLELIGEESRFCVEIGAGDGLWLSNTANLRERGWTALLAEADDERFGNLERNAPEAECVHVVVGPGNINELIGGRAVDVMSIDVDGDDWFILEAMTCRPRVLVIEFNCSVPPNLSMRGAALGGCFGASAKAMVELATAKGYALVGVNHTNAYFVPEELAPAFEGYETDLSTLMAGRRWAVAVSDYSGRPYLVDSESFWWGFTGFVDPLTEELVIT